MVILPHIFTTLLLRILHDMIIWVCDGWNVCMSPRTSCGFLNEGWMSDSITQIKHWSSAKSAIVACENINVFVSNSLWKKRHFVILLTFPSVELKSAEDVFFNSAAKCSSVHHNAFIRTFLQVPLPTKQDTNIRNFHIWGTDRVKKNTETLKKWKIGSHKELLTALNH